MSSPLVSIIMPTRNQARWLPAALASIEAQTFRDFKLVVVDDGSTDETPGILGSWARDDLGFPVTRVRRQLGTGAAAAINKGAEYTEGSAYRTWVSSDNEMAPDWLEVLVWEAETHRCDDLATSAFGAAYGGFTYVRPDGTESYLFTPHTPSRQVTQEDCYYGPAFLIRADVWDEAGPHRGAISHDLDHWLRVEEVCQRRGLAIVGVDRSLCRYNAHDERATVKLADQYDAPRWMQEAKRRRGLAL